jgi:hypothetical protein
VCGSLVEPKAAARMSGADVETVKSIDLDIWTPEQMDVSFRIRSARQHCCVLMGLRLSRCRSGGTIEPICTGNDI